jgi:thiol-disulfide isomerase/thioredoxin
MARQGPVDHVYVVNRATAQAGGGIGAGGGGLRIDVTGLIVVVLTLVLASVVGLLLRRSGRRLAADGSAAGQPAVVLGPADLGAELGQRATLVQFSSAFCAPCRTTRVVLGDVSRLVDGVTYVEVDAESNLELVRRLDVRRTPTVLVLDASGAVVRRASGAPRKADVLAALGAAVA